MRWGLALGQLLVTALAVVGLYVGGFGRSLDTAVVTGVGAGLGVALTFVVYDRFLASR